jgi:G1/S-specific cyclin PLC1
MSDVCPTSPVIPLSSGLSHIDSPTACHRVFLATLIVAAKYLNDSCPKNIHWAKYTGYFGVFEITRTEVELLAILDYDLRFDEAETRYHFAPFMRTKAQEKRAAAVSVVTKAGLARALAQMPPTPPREKSSQSGSLSGVQVLVKRLSSVCLSSATTACASPAQRNPSGSSSIKSTPSFTCDSSDLSSVADSDSEWPLISDSAVDTRAHGIDRQQIVPASFHLKPVPVHAYRRLRKTSTTASSPSGPECVEGSRPANPVNSTPSSTLSSLTIRLVNAPEDSLDSENSGHISGLPSRSVSWGSLLKNDTRGLTRTGTIHSRKEGSFLSRMWGVATRSIHDRTDKQDLLNPDDMIEPEVQEEYGTGAIRHVTHSRSAIIRAQSQEYLV